VHYFSFGLLFAIILNYFFYIKDPNKTLSPYERPQPVQVSILERSCLGALALQHAASPEIKNICHCEEERRSNRKELSKFEVATLRSQ